MLQNIFSITIGITILFRIKWTLYVGDPNEFRGRVSRNSIVKAINFLAECIWKKGNILQMIDPAGPHCIKLNIFSFSNICKWRPSKEEQVTTAVSKKLYSLGRIYQTYHC